MNDEHATQLVLAMQDNLPRIANSLNLIKEALESLDLQLREHTETLEMLRKDLWDIPRAIRGEPEGGS